MSYKVENTEYFARQFKRLARKYPTLKNDLSKLIISLEINPEQGTPI